MTAQYTYAAIFLLSLVLIPLYFAFVRKKQSEPLGIREREILEMILGNKKRKDIAESLHLSENTVKTYTRSLYSKLGVSCREELYALLLQNNN